MFAVWLQFGILGLPIKKEFGLSDTAFYWLTALPVLNGAIWRLWTGVLADRWGGRVVMTGDAAHRRGPDLPPRRHARRRRCSSSSRSSSASPATRSQLGIAWNSAWFPRSQQGFALGVFGAGNVGASVTKLIGPAIIAAHGGHGVPRRVRRPAAGGSSRSSTPSPLVVMAAVLWFVAPEPGPPPGRARRRCASTSSRSSGCGCGASASTTSRCSAPTSRCRRRCRFYYETELRRRAVAGRPAHRAVHLPGVAAAPARRLDVGQGRRPPDHVLDLRRSCWSPPASS